MDTQSKDQGKDQSKDQGAQNTETQPEKEVTVAGKTYSSLQDLAADYENLNKEFHKRNQERKEESEVEPSTEEKKLQQAMEALKPYLEKEFPTKKELETYKREQDMEAIMTQNPTLASNEALFRLAVKEHPDLSLEEVVSKYKLNKGDKLQKARLSGDVQGTDPHKPKEELTLDGIVTEEQLQEWEKKHNVGKKGRFEKAREV